jgi:hypothetical protein
MNDDDLIEPFAPQEFEVIKAALALAITGEPLPSFRDLGALKLLHCCARLSEYGSDSFFTMLGAYSAKLLVDQLQRSGQAEVELYKAFPSTRNH